MSVNILPEGWVSVTLADICSKPQYGYTTKSQLDGNVKFLRTTDITKGLLNWDSVPYCEDPPTDLYKYQLYDRDIVISRAGSIGFSALIKNPPKKVVFASYLIRFKPSEFISEVFIKYFLNSHDYWTQLRLMSAGNAVQNVNAQKLSILNVPLPPLAEQKIIADKLDDLLARVESIKTRLENIPEILKRFRQSVLSAAVSGKLTEEWRKENNQSFSDWISCNVGEVSTVSTGKTPKRNEPRFWANGSIPWLTSSSTGDINTHIAEQFVTEAALEECNLKLYSPGTLLLAMYGEGKTRGQVTEIKISATCNQACAAITCDETKIITHFLKLRLLENYQEIRKAAVGGNQPNLNLNKVRDIFVLAPSLAEQKEIINRVNHFFDYANFTEKMLGKALSRIYDLTQSILAKAFRGELTAQWREENPELISGLNSADALLEKITAEKLAAGTVKKRAKKTSH